MRSSYTAGLTHRYDDNESVHTDADGRVVETPAQRWDSSTTKSVSHKRWRPAHLCYGMWCRYVCVCLSNQLKWLVVACWLDWWFGECKLSTGNWRLTSAGCDKHNSSKAMPYTHCREHSCCCCIFLAWYWILCCSNIPCIIVVITVVVIDTEMRTK